MVEVVAALIWDKDKFLVCQRPVNKARALLWEFVGGKVEQGETKEQALIRECKEELNITVKPNNVFMEVVHEYSDITVHLTLFNAEIVEGVPQKLEHNDIKWITPAEIPDYDFCPADEEILKKIGQNKIIKYHAITKKWGNNKECRMFARRIDKWLSQFEENEKPLMLDLLRHFTYYSERTIKKQVVKLFEEFKKVYNGKFIISPIQKELGVGYSDFVYDVFWMTNDVKDYAERNIINIANETDFLDVPTLVFIDDYAGSGKTFIRFHKKLININQNIKDKEIYLLAITCSSIALKNISEYATSNNYRINLISLKIQGRAFLDNYLYKQVESEINRRKYEEICRKYSVLNDYIFGFNEIEALISFEYNTPNNTLGIIWHNLNDFCCLFKRHKTEKTDLKTIQEKIKKRKRIKKEKPVIQNIEETKVNIFILYCVVEGKDFSVSNACKDLGLVPKQVDELMSEIIEEGYISLEEGFPSATSKLKETMFTSRIQPIKKIIKSESIIESKEISIKESEINNYFPKNFELSK